MTYLCWRPTGPLAAHVESLWIQESAGPEQGERFAPTRVLPTGCADLVLNYGDPFVRSLPEGEEACPTVGLGGQLSHQVAFRATGRTGLLLVRLQPWSTGFFGPASELTDTEVDLAGVVGEAACRELMEQVAEAPDPDAKVRVLERFMTARLPAQAIDRRVVEVVQCMRARPGQHTVAELAAHVGMSRRHLMRLFLRTVGIGPKAFSRVVRLQAALNSRRRGVSWSEVAVRCGFADQAHLGHECTDLAGLAPGELARLSASGPLQEYFNPGGAGGGVLTNYF